MKYEFVEDEKFNTGLAIAGIVALLVNFLTGIFLFSGLWLLVYITVLNMQIYNRNQVLKQFVKDNDEQPE